MDGRRNHRCGDNLIKHIVMWNVSGDSQAKRAEAAGIVKQKFEGLRGKVPGLLEIEVGIDESGVDYACDVVLYSVFQSAEALAAYASDPSHLMVREELGGIRIARHQVDYRIDSKQDGV